jgi:hypothetical protein
VISNPPRSLLHLNIHNPNHDIHLKHCLDIFGGTVHCISNRDLDEHSSIHTFTHPYIHPPITMAEFKPSALTRSLTHNPRPETIARNMCPQHDPIGALTLVATDVVWQQMPVNLTNPIDVAASQQAVYRAHPTWDLPAMMQQNNASAAVVSIYRLDLQRSRDYAIAESALLTLLLASIGDTNTDLLATDFPGIRPYALSSRQVVDLMTRKHGIATSDDITKLREPLSLALTSLSDLESHMAKFILLASQREAAKVKPRTTTSSSTCLRWPDSPRWRVA